MGVRLIYRSTRQFGVTDIGLAYYEHCKAMLIEAEAAQAIIDMTRAEPQGVIRLSCPIALLQTSVGYMLADFMVLHPRVTIQIDATNRRVDPVAEAIDIALRVRPPPLQDSNLIMRTLSDRSQCLVASPALMERCGVPAAPADLADWPSLGLGQPQQQFSWTLFGPDSAQAVIHHFPRLITTDMIGLRIAALAGVGIVQLPTLMVCDQLAQGTLVRPLPDWRPRREIIHAVFSSRRGQMPAVRALIDYLVQRFDALEED
ncbi:LysR family transcriptional regulator [Advenella kashmirensis WT001]|uniref:LysR family transcriptional regulator n=1 Tax=Advenella kashmirensis (strain DSM 17095 / LMG 22695 / WT001) TaxID=1036672 RepID=I3UGG8_ADVKW|nr:LysR family transcriptional regulator [Advenella kashmirensis WT001]